MPELMPCPFCGAQADAEGEHQHEADCFFSAYDRLLHAKNSSLSEVPAVLRGWNKRAIPSNQVLVPREVLEGLLDPTNLARYFEAHRAATVILQR